MAWQFDQPDKGKGMVQVFRHDQSSSAATHFKLQGLEAKARYTVVNLAEPAVNQEFDGRELMDSGIPVVVPNPRAAAVLLYQRKFRLQSAK
jgi:alpha-galactosidase